MQLVYLVGSDKNAWTRDVDQVQIKSMAKIMHECETIRIASTFELAQEQLIN